MARFIAEFSPEENFNTKHSFLWGVSYVENIKQEEVVFLFAVKDF